MTVQLLRLAQLVVISVQNPVELSDDSDQVIEVYREPTPTGYQNVQRLRRGQSLSILAFPEINLMVDEVLG